MQQIEVARQLQHNYSTFYFMIHPIIITYHFKLLGFGFPNRNPNKKVFTQNLSGHSGLRLNLIVYNIDGWAAMCV